MVFRKDYMVHQFGSSEDYNKLARETGDSSLSWDRMKRYIFKVGQPLILV